MEHLHKQVKSFLWNLLFTELISVGKIHEIAHAILNFKRHFETVSESSGLKML